MFTSEAMIVQGQELSQDELAALAKLGNLVVSRGEAEEASHKQVLDACEDLARSFIQRSEDTLPGTSYTCTSLPCSSFGA